MGTKRRSRLPLVRGKLELIDFAIERLGARSFADLGGVWGVEGGYTFYALDRGAASAVMVDTHLSGAFRERAGQEPRLRVVEGNFGEPAAAEQVGHVDAVLLFDTLLHQVAPDWDEVLDAYARRASCLLIYNQQWIGPGRAVRLLELGEGEYFRNVPHDPGQGPYANLFERLDTPHPDHGGRLWRDVHHIWQWGITDADLLGRTQALGFRFLRFSNDGRCGSLAHFENHAFVFGR